VTAAGNRIPGDYRSKLLVDLEPEQPADSAVRAILLELLTAIHANVDGTIDDLDAKFLHDLRVACRRTRTALTQLKGVLPAETASSFNAKFKWLGSVTGPLRDLDVFLLEMPTYYAILSARAVTELEPLAELIRTTRNRALISVADALRSSRFTQLVTSWRQTLEANEPSRCPHASRPTVELANEHITKAHRRILKRGKEFDKDLPTGTLHRLRIDAKKLRYLLEFFHSLYPERDINARIKELKRLQDILGGFNDVEVQLNLLSDFTRELHADPAVTSSCTLTLGRLAGILEESQEDHRAAFHDAFLEFSSKPVRAAFKRLFGGKSGDTQTGDR